jgi:hypothetical protein
MVRAKKKYSNWVTEWVPERPGSNVGREMRVYYPGKGKRVR